VALELFISRRAAREIDRVAGWWAANRPAAPGAVRKDLEATFALLVQQGGLGHRGALVAMPPLTWGSKAEFVELEGDDYRIPAEAVDAGFMYRLGKEDLETLLRYAREKRMSEKAVAEFVIYYAVFDGYPAWFDDIPNA
jgi:plasmid stabilization system protein ParE